MTKLASKQNLQFIFGCILIGLQIGCANIQLVSSANNHFKFCTNPGNQMAKVSDFNAAASKQCGGSYRNVSSGLEFYTDPKAPKIGGVLEVQTQRRMCSTYVCE